MPVALGQRQQFQQRARLVEPPDSGRNGNTVDTDIEAAQHPDSNVLRRHAFSVSPSVLLGRDHEAEVVAGEAPGAAAVRRT